MSTTACSEGIDRPPIVWEGEHLRFGAARELDDVCAGTLPTLDRLVGWLSDAFDREPAPLDFYWVPDEFSDYCPSTSLGCADEGIVFSRYPFHQHELVHAIRGEYATVVFEEGLAEAYGDDWEPMFPLMGETVDMFERHAGDSSMKGTWYPLAGQFVAYLRETYGREALLAFDEASEPHESFDATLERFEQTFGVGLAQAAGDHEAADGWGCVQTRYRERGFECGGDAVRLSADPVSARATARSSSRPRRSSRRSGRCPRRGTGRRTRS